MDGNFMIWRGLRITGMNPFLPRPCLVPLASISVGIQCFPALYTCIYMCSAEELGFDTTTYVGRAGRRSGDN